MQNIRPLKIPDTRVARRKQ